jgi:hypothetical protein
MSDKANTEYLESYNKIRKTWTCNPVEKIVPNKKKRLKVNKDKHKNAWRVYDE